MKTIDFLKPVLLLCALVTGNASVRADITYNLTPVTSVEAGNLYVFELTYKEKDSETEANYVMNNEVNSSKELLTTTSYKTSGLSGSESYVWTLEAKNGGFYMKNVSRSSEQYLNNSTSGSTNVSFGSKSSVWAFNLQTTDNTFLIQNTSNSDRFLGMNVDHCFKAYATSSMNTYQHAIKVYKLVKDVYIGTVGIATLCSDKALDFSGTGVKAYTAKVDGGVVKLSEISNGIVPANTGVILYCENAGTYSIPVTTKTNTISDNELVGVTTPTTVTKTTADGKFNYILQSDGNGGIVFNMAIEDGATLPAGKAYLSTDYESPAPGPSPVRLSVVFADEAQGISATLNNKEIMNNVVYDLQGRPIANSRLPKGLYIVNGKKTVVK